MVNVTLRDVYAVSSSNVINADNPLGVVIPSAEPKSRLKRMIRTRPRQRGMEDAMTIWNPGPHSSFGSLRTALGYAAAAVISIGVWVALASLMA
jgi:hypothetical protein